ncbi:DEAD/DEAH box helicase [Actinomyces gaoshouyii]|uniref:Helicase n=1 Tax=Actinomyces gaoshouyii TaxID=1960083 RepID=A0A8H9HDK0_9ACTO|nr:DEAD/DEAH box helicase [Actinomyces gaoshouyii]GGO98508.1 helicase [Actinomyces gaoshouyii]
MTLLLPSLQAERIRAAIVDYLSTTFALTDAEPRRALTDFLQNEHNGVFVGPFVRLRLPYVPASARSEVLDWDPGLTPYRHQEQAYQRLTTKGGHRPQPTLITTGTGSGKTEAFLHPVLDHVLRARAEGVTGLKALILYPMNALASDQAGRLARLLTSDSSLAGIRAALYTGDASATPTASVSPSSLITDRHAIRADPPDILLTNYKMLDQLLLRPEDRALWSTSASSLTYLILDEFHTYDGAQGTDVAMLLRRLGLALRAHLADDDPRQADYERSPLGPVCPVATSATLGDGGDPTHMLAFARDVFGADLPVEAIVTETRTDLDTWAKPHRAATARLGLKARRLTALSPTDLAHLADLADQPVTDSAQLLADVVSILYQPQDDQPADRVTDLIAPNLAHAIQSHPDIIDLISRANRAAPLAGLAASVLSPAQLTDPAVSRQALAVLLAALSTIRAGLDGAPDRSAIGVEVTLWIREVTRVDRLLDARPAFRWSDTADRSSQDVPARPALYCRSCGRSGWGISLAPTGQGEKADQSEVRRDRVLGDTRFRALLAAPGEEADYRRRVETGEPDPARHHPGLRWYSVADRELLTRIPEEGSLETREGRYLPVLVLTGDDRAIAEDTTHDVCPSCGAADSIRFLGSAVATLLSVSLTTLFGDDALDDADKRALIFTDSVQDAAHRAGFIDQRSHTMSLRSALRDVLNAETTLSDWADTTLDAAANDAFDRYRLVPAALAEHPQFKPYWEPDATASERRKAAVYVRRRLLFDIALEIGLQSTYGRTLEATGSLTVHVDAGQSMDLIRIAREALGEGGAPDALPGLESLTEAGLLAWVRGTVERMRRDGAIDHEWLKRYKEEDGKRLWIWYKRRRDQGQPAFPAGRSAPSFPQVKGNINTRYSAFTPVLSPKSWYAIWARACLGVAPTHAARLAVALLAQLAEADILSATPTVSGGTVYGLPTDRVFVTPLGAGSTDKLLLVCDVCRSQLPAAPATVDQLAGAPCLVARCPGRLAATRHPADSFYRSMYTASHVRRVDAHEHTSLLSAAKRAAVEEGFKRPVQRPADPNVLVATPTLEMGIDIGDLSTVMLDSLPDAVASYVQRVGRAGRRSGSALALAYVRGRPNQIRLLEDPAHLLDGAVAPPSTYLGAEEILRRQFLAYVIDTLTREGHPAVPGGGRGRANARTVFDTRGQGTFLAAVIERIARDGAVLAAAFTATFTNRTPALGRLAHWVSADDGAGPRLMLEQAAAEYRAEIKQLHHQREQIDAALPELIAATERPNATEEDRRAWRGAESAHKAIDSQLIRLNNEPWIAALERHGVLPNYALIDDSVRLSARVSWRDPETDEFTTEPYDLDRASAHALRELAPGAAFYTHGMEMRIDGVDSSNLAAQARWWLTCASCGYVQDDAPSDTPPAAPSQCPRCGDTSIADVGRARRVLRLTRVFADVARDDARISDTRDERASVSFEVLPLADLDPTRAERQWSVKATGLGLSRFRNLPLRWLNTGRALPGQSVDQVGSTPVRARGFRLCEACGKLDSSTGVSSPGEHRAWCAHRGDPREHVIQMDLMRDLVTEALAIILPQEFASDPIGVASLASALMLGLEIATGGTPDHLGVMAVTYPVGQGGPGETRPALLLHDTVPGGTGYLTGLDEPTVMWGLLVSTAQRLETCRCAAEGKDLCHHCLQRYTVDTATREVSRASALHALRLILGLDTHETAGDLDPAEPRWTVTDEPVRAGHGESPLEARFRTELKELLSARMSVRVIGDASGAPALELDGGRWRLRPQLDVGRTRPDFTALHVSGRAPIAIYTDGLRYHASRKHNRLADDAAKRAELRDHGYRVISVAKEDLDGAWNPQWLGKEAATSLMNAHLVAARAAAITDEAIEVWRGGPMALLAAMLRDEDGGVDTRSTALSALAASVGVPLIHGAAEHSAFFGDATLNYAKATRPEADPTWEAVHALLPSQALPAPLAPTTTVSGAVFYGPHLALAIQISGTSTTGMALVIDDSEEALASPEHRDAWLSWLRLSNVLPLSGVPVTITTTSRALEELGDRATVADGPGSDASAMRDLGWDGIDRELAAPQVLTLLPYLAAAGVRFGREGQEEADGIMTDLSWPDKRVAVVVDPHSDEVTALTAADWRVVRVGHDAAVTADEIRTLLEGR